MSERIIAEKCWGCDKTIDEVPVLNWPGGELVSFEGHIWHTRCVKVHQARLALDRVHAVREARIEAARAWAVFEQAVCARVDHGRPPVTEAQELELECYATAVEEAELDLAKATKAMLDGK